MSKKVNFAEMDVRIRDRRIEWTKAEREQLDKDLKKLPDLAEQIEAIEIPQPALAQPEEAAEEGAEDAAPADGAPAS